MTPSEQDFDRAIAAPDKAHRFFSAKAKIQGMNGSRMAALEFEKLTADMVFVRKTLDAAKGSRP